jgi:GT2 family glycosyltransferase/glycosyltransferase involved in cell wall biosynthesis
MEIKAGVYIRHLDNIGGGGVHGCQLIEFLSENYEVDVFTNHVVNMALLREKLGFEFNKKVKFKLYEKGIENNYYIFLNISHWDIIRTNSPKRFALVFFPQFEYPRNGFHLLANSEYTAKEIKKKWKIKDYGNVSVLYPPVSSKDILKETKGIEKENIIVHCSRFNKPMVECDKGHRELITAFKELNRENRVADWNFQMVGQVQDESYFQDLMARGASGGVKFNVSMNRKDLINLYGRSKIYWHMTGISMPNSSGAQEHFGMTTVEAMAAGCVPVVYGTGGQPEIIDDGKNGFLIKNIDEMVEKTLFLIGNKREMERMSKEAIKKAQKFDKSVIKQIFLRLMSNINKVSVVMVCHNQAHLTEKALKSFIEHTPGGYELIIVNNASTDNTVEILSQYANKENIKIINTSTNLSYSEANNKGIKEAKGEYILLLNNDIEAYGNFLDPMVDILDENNEVGAVGARMYFPKTKTNGRLVIQHMGIDFNSEGDSFHINHWKEENEVVEGYRVVKAATGACLLVRKELAKLPEKYEHGYYEDTELCLEIRKKGFEVVVCDDAKLFHYEGGTQVTIDDKVRHEYLAKNRELFIKTWKNSWLL